MINRLTARGRREGGPTNRPPLACLLAQTQLLDDGAVAVDVPLLQVAEELAALADHLLQTPAGVVVLRVRLQVGGQLPDAGRQNGDLQQIIRCPPRGRRTSG